MAILHPTLTIYEHKYQLLYHSKWWVFKVRLIPEMTCRVGLVVMALLLVTHSILLPVKSNYSRCLMEYSTTADGGSIKIRINLPQVTNSQPGDHYSISVRNTETEATDSSVAKPDSKYIKQIEAAPSVLYEVCVHLKTERSTEAIIDYQTQIDYSYSHEEVKVPDSLVKKEDLKDTFVAAERMAETIEWYNQEQEKRKGEGSVDFFETDRLHSKLSILSGIECLVVVAVGVYQFFTIKNYLENRRYV